VSLITHAVGFEKLADSRYVSPEIVTRRARADHLLSKLIAGGLSAGVVLLWWPRVVPHDSAVSWVARGIGWTLLAEILVVALSPLELVLRTRLATLAPVGRLRGLGARSRQGAYVVLAAVAVCLPLTLIATGQPAPAAQPPKQITNVTRVVKVVKPVQVKKIVVRRTAPAPVTYVPATAGAPVATPRPATSVRPVAPTPSHKRTTTQTQHPAADTGSETSGTTMSPAATPDTATPTPAPGF
jgi:hypothetical protein